MKISNRNERTLAPAEDQKTKPAIFKELNYSTKLIK